MQSINELFNVPIGGTSSRYAIRPMRSLLPKKLAADRKGAVADKPPLHLLAEQGGAASHISSNHLQVGCFGDACSPAKKQMASFVP
jgi:hypothetical protein